MWLLFCLLSTLVAGLVAIPAKKVAEKNKNMMQISIVGTLYYHMIFLIMVLLVNPQIFLTFNFNAFIDILPLAVLQILGAICYYVSLKYTLVSTSTLITKCKVLVPLILGVVILGESLSIIQIVLATLLIVFTLIISKNKSGVTDEKSNLKGIILAYSFVILSGVASFLNKLYINKYEDPMILIFYVAVITICIVTIYFIFAKDKACLNPKNINSKVCFFTFVILDVLSSLFNRFSLVNGPVSIISVIESSSIVITILASYFILKEKLSLKKVIMVILIIICVIALACFS